MMKYKIEAYILTHTNGSRNPSFEAYEANGKYHNHDKALIIVLLDLLFSIA